MELEGEDHLQAGARRGARDRIIGVAYELFSRRGIRAVGVDELIATSGVAKATFYKHFRTKDDLVLAYLERWYQARSAAIAEAAARHEGNDDAALLSIFDVFDEWFRQGAAEVNSFLHVLIEMGPNHPLGKASIGYLAKTRQQIAEAAANAGLRDPEDFAWSAHVLIKGSMVAAAEGDPRAASRARQMAADLIQQYRRSPDGHATEAYENGEESTPTPRPKPA